jgi:DNA-binding NarL/FixJ family response regulator
MAAVSVLLLDDHPVFRVGMVNTIQEVSPEYVIFEAGTSIEAFDILDKTPIDLAFIDISLKDEHGIEVCSAMSTSHPQVACFILSMHKELALVHQAKGAKARGYILKDSPLELIKEILLAFPNLPEFITHQELELNQTNDGEYNTYIQLTEREKEIFRYLALGYNYKEIAYLLKISMKTSSVHRYNIIQKMGLSDQASIIRAALSLGIITNQEILQGPIQ